MHIGRPFRALSSLAALVLPAALASCGGGGEASGPPEPGRLEIVGAASFDGRAGASLQAPPRVKVSDTRGRPMGGVTLAVAVTAGGGTSAPSATTGADGTASLAWTLGTVAGPNGLRVSLGTLPAVDFAALAGPNVAQKLVLVVGPPATAQSRVAFATQPSVQVQDEYGNAVPQAGTVVTAAGTGSAGPTGSIGGTATASTNASGRATFTDLHVAGVAGSYTLSFSAAGLAGASSALTLGAGLPASIAHASLATQSGAVGSPVTLLPAVQVRDADGNGVPGVAVTFAVTGGGGSVAGASATTNGLGIATVGGWTLGPAAGANTLAASAAGLAGSPVTFTATAVTFAITGVSPAVLTPGATATITGVNFGATAAENQVTIDGVAAAVTAATSTQLTITVPTALPCEATHDGTVALTVGGGSATRAHPVRAAALHTLGVGQSVVLGTAAAARCNELAVASGSRYLLAVYNTNTTYTPTGAAFTLRGAPATGSASASPDAPPAVAGAPAPASLAASGAAAPARDAAERARAAEAERLHQRVLDENLAFLERQARAPGRAGPALSRAAAPPPAVGDQIALRVPNLSVSNFCSTYYEITARVAYVGARSVVLEDVANPLAGTIDSTYADIGAEFDATMFPLLEANYGNPLAMDAATDADGRVRMVFTRRVNDHMTGLGGFVVSCDLFARGATSNTQSNHGEYFYARVPTVAGTIATPTSGGDITPPRWRWSMRSTILHEVKHVTSFAERVARKASVFETSWLEETTARVSEEIYARGIYGAAQKSNIGYGSAASPGGPWCEVRLFAPCVGRPRGFYRVWEELASQFYPSSPSRSPLGRVNASDFSFYATGWSLVRWAIDHHGLTESAFLRALTQETALNGVANLVARTGRPFAEMQPEWALAMALDDRPEFTPANPRLTMPSWNLRSVFAGLSTDFASTFPLAFPLAASGATFGAFAHSGAVFPGTVQYYELAGPQSFKQLVELRASSGTLAAPAELRVAIVRVQ